MYEGPSVAHGNCLQLWNQVVRDTYKSYITAQAWSGIKGAGGAAPRTVTLFNVQLSCRSHTPNKLHLTWEKRGDIWTAPASELFSQDSALAFTVAAVAFSLLSRRFYGVQPLNPHCRSLFRPIHSAAHPPNRAGIIESVDSLVVFQFVSPDISFLNYLIRLCNFIAICIIIWCHQVEQLPLCLRCALTSAVEHLQL